MDIELKMIRNTLIIRLKGEFDLLKAEKIRRLIDEKLQDKQARNLILNLEKVSFVDSSGLGVIIGRYKKIQEKEGSMYIVGAQPVVEKILTLSGINKLIPLFKNEQEALKI
ncbi:MAG TPA: anti-sigma F factor antagonist [Syntrophomonadaceae bacterium]|mgnify:CR=1 FL=1|nr:anti-sigma F factor antagonist [Syntrophomonadaceae bacterium]HRX20127.1 anti-sigma F factor antagonist [Syntrophomonadaceae bacterium]